MAGHRGVDTLRNMPSSRILRTLDFGAMMTIAYQLRREEREAVARFLGKAGGDPQPRPEAFCSDRSVSIDTSASPVWNGWSPSPDNSRFSPAALAKPDCRAGVEAEAEMGVWIRGRHLRVLAADGDRQPGLHRQRRRRGARAARGHRLSAVDVSGQRDRFARRWWPRRWTAGHVLLFGDLTGWFYALDAATRQRGLAQAARGARGRASERAACRRTTASRTWPHRRGKNRVR